MRGFIIIFSFLAIYACKPNDETPQTGGLIIQLEHFVDGKTLVSDSMMYTNAAGNEYEVTEVQWFISDVSLKKANGDLVPVSKEKFAHYIDSNIPASMIWEIAEKIPAGEYTSVMMTFGIKGEKNKPNMYTDTPESAMVWPMHMGGDQGGYHYMKLNGFWRNLENQRQPFNFHLGVGQLRRADDTIVGFVQNWFEVELPASRFQLAENGITTIGIRMNTEKWWETPHAYDHNYFGGSIMKNQEAMGQAVENGRNVFTFSGVIDVKAF